MMTEVSTIWKDFHRELRAFIQTKTRNSSDTDDILQEAFIKIIRNFDKVSQSANLRHYLYGIVRNTISDHFRNSKSTEGAENVTEPFSPGETQTLNATIAECCIKPFINKLPAHYREALLITEFQQVSQKELAMMLGISYSGAKSRVQRGKEKLKELILSCCLYQSDVYGNLLNTGKKKCSCS